MNRISISALVWVLAGLCAYLYFVSVHRVVHLKDVHSVLTIASKPNVNSRCKRYNDTAYSCLPNVLFIGASKCGTTSMVQYLGQHPHVEFVGRRIHKKDHHREVHRFDRNSFGYAIRGVDLYDEWASAPLVASVNTTVIHYTPHYLYAPTVPYDVKSFYPHSSELKFIVMLRNPVDRAISSYWFQRSHLFNERDLGSTNEFIALAEEEMKDRRQYESCMAGELFMQHSIGNSSLLWREVYQAAVSLKSDLPGGSRSPLYQALMKCFGSELRSKSLGHRHVDKGVYVDQIIRWTDNFRLEQFLFISLQDMHDHPQATYQRILNFLEVPRSSGDVSSSSVDPVVSSIRFESKRLEKPNSLSEDLPATFRQKLSDYYEPYNLLLQHLFNIKL